MVAHNPKYFTSVWAEPVLFILIVTTLCTLCDVNDYAVDLRPSYGYGIKS